MPPACLLWCCLPLLVGASSADAGGAGVTSERMVGQRLVVAMAGTTPSPALLARVRAGHVGGVILFGSNVRDASQVRALTASLHAAARDGGQPPLLVAVDQEGGGTRRFSWLPPTLSAAELGRLAPARVRRVGEQTGHALRRLGVDVDLAPVADVPRVQGAFIAEQRRAFASDPARVAVRAQAFAAGLAAARVAGTAKHFPGLGRSAINTDRAAATIAGGDAALAADLIPFRRLVGDGIPLVMVSNAVYSALGPAPAAWSTAVQRLLRGDLGFAGVTITDALEPVAGATGLSIESSAVRSAQAGVDLLLFAGDERATAAVYERLLAAVREGAISRSSLERSYARILTLKERFG